MSKPAVEDREVAVLKLRTVHQYIQYVEGVSAYLTVEIDKIEDLRDEPGSPGLIEKVNEVLLDSRQPCPSISLIRADLGRVAEELGPSYATRLARRRHLLEQAGQRVASTGGVVCDMTVVVIEGLRALRSLLGTAISPARRLRERLINSLNDDAKAKLTARHRKRAGRKKDP